jgi:uncharacterized protein YjbI with pentapeptide repeats
MTGMARRSVLASILAALGLHAKDAGAAGTVSTRRTYEQSVARLRGLGYLGKDETPVAPVRMPRYDDEEPLGVSFFRTEVIDADLSGLTLPRTFFGRSEIARTSFRDTDLSESSLCWNDFVAVDFSDASLAGADLRASVFEDCRFDRALMTGAVVTRGQIAAGALSQAQRRAIDWRDKGGPEPDGG